MPTVARTKDIESSAASWPLGRIGLLVAGLVLVVVYVVLLLIRTTSTVTEKGANGAITKITETKDLYPETTSSVVVGAAILMIIVAGFYNRITKITGPGGIAIEFQSSEKKGAADAVAEEVKNEDLPIKAMAISAEPAPEGAASDAAKSLASRTSVATLDVLQDARHLLKIADTGRSNALDLATKWQVPSEAAEAFIDNRQSSSDLWRALARKALGSS